MKFGKKNKYAARAMDAIGESGGCVYILLDEPDHIPVYVSEGIRELMGISAESVMADIYALQWCITDEEKIRSQKFVDAWNRNEADSREFEFKNAETKEDGYAKATLSMTDEGLLVELQDFRSELKIRKKLHEKLDKVKTEERQKSDYLSKMSHEIRTPMNGILGMITLAKTHIDNTEEALKCLDKANGLSQFLLSLINDILDMSKIERGKVVLEHEKFDLLEVYNKVCEMFAGSIEQKGIEFETRMEDMDIRYVVGDSLRLTQILVNFVSNANKYTDRGGKIEFVFRAVNRTEDSVHMLFRIKDNGKGMDPAFLNRIFKPFEQETASTTRKFGGTGLGMAIADNLVSLMGGHIVVDTAIGRGTEFSVYIPLDIAEGDQSWDNTESIDKEEKNRISISGMRVLLAEDNAINAEIASEILKMDGVLVEVADDGIAAIDMLNEKGSGYYDLILMDIQMPRMDGWTAAKKIRSMNSDYAQRIPIYALSANAFVEDKRHSIEMGMNGHFSKPIDFEKLKTIMGEIRAQEIRQ